MPGEQPKGGGFYRFVFRSFFSRLDPERAHHLAMPVIRLAGWPIIGHLLRATCRPGPELRTRVAGLNFSTPFGLAAGFDKDATMVRGLANLGFGHVEVGTVTALAQSGNERPRLFRLIQDRALINRMGFNNSGAHRVRRRLDRLRSVRSTLIIGVNIGKSRAVDVEDAVDDYLVSARLLAPVADYVVVNVSSPNTPGLRGLQDIKNLEPLVRAVHGAVDGVPLFVKIAPDLTDKQVDGIADMCVEIGIAGIIATNTTISRAGLSSDAQTIAVAGEGGLSGPPVADRSREVVRRLRSRVPRTFALVAAGGVESADDVRSRLADGADLVQGYTGFVYFGPGWARSITRGLNSTFS
ncbi:MAG: quinone-dependent dihydroorotate dehydrogenase [Actinobacteria bacterium]|uniref:dihydroorotate dehydrogenase (quinone) n=1 Tax=freshwater metagenome TaxID=449393 RepID=A0A6J7G3B5_9ZZZZ|nr:quinone-dependent dihydroorotate dehydrogenase [Actinomycetota bacterium]